MIQLFDSWAGALSVAAYEQMVLPYSRRILEAVAETGVPTIHFGTTTSHLLESMARCGSDVISVDWRLPLDEAWRRIGDRGIQGNLDPGVMLAPVRRRRARGAADPRAGRRAARATSSTSATECSPRRRATTSGAWPSSSTRKPPGA